MKKMTKAILCLVSVWGACWAEHKEVQKNENTETETVENITVNTAYNAEEESVNAEENSVEETTEDIPENNLVKTSLDAVGDEVAEASEEEIDDEKEEISASDANTLAENLIAEGDSIAPQTLDFSTWVNPAVKPVRTTSPYKIRRGRLHRGVDVKVAIGDSIVAVSPGKVVISRYNRGGYGNYIVLKHENGTQTVYGHLSKRLKKVGETVEQGELIGLGGNTGRSTGSHLHFEIRYGEINIDPSTVINFDEGCLQENVGQYSIADATASHKAIQKELSKHRVHRIRPGDTLGKLAHRYGTTIDRICKLNKISRNSVLRIGKLLQIS